MANNGLKNTLYSLGVVGAMALTWYAAKNHFGDQNTTSTNVNLQTEVTLADVKKNLVLTYSKGIKKDTVYATYKFQTGPCADDFKKIDLGNIKFDPHYVNKFKQKDCPPDSSDYWKKMYQSLLPDDSPEQTTYKKKDGCSRQAVD